MLTLIVARARNGAIGKDGDIPWNLPEDLVLFQRETTGGALIMGRKTWDSLPVRPLKRRLNLVVSSDPGVAEHVCATPQAAVEAAHAASYSRIYGIGGGGVYQSLLPLADRLLITEVDLDVPDADTFFPEIEAKDWRVTRKIPLREAGPRCVAVEHLR